MKVTVIFSFVVIIVSLLSPLESVVSVVDVAFVPSGNWMKALSSPEIVTSNWMSFKTLASLPLSTLVKSISSFLPAQNSIDASNSIFSGATITIAASCVSTYPSLNAALVTSTS